MVVGQGQGGYLLEVDSALRIQPENLRGNIRKFQVALDRQGRDAKTGAISSGDTPASIGDQKVQCGKPASTGDHLVLAGLLGLLQLRGDDKIVDQSLGCDQGPVPRYRFPASCGRSRAR